MDIFEQIESLREKGIVIDVVAVNQIENGYEEQVKAGSMPLITYTVEVLDTSLEVLYAESCNNLKEALKAGVAAANKLLAERSLLILRSRGEVGSWTPNNLKTCNRYHLNTKL